MTIYTMYKGVNIIYSIVYPLYLFCTIYELLGDYFLFFIIFPNSKPEVLMGHQYCRYFKYNCECWVCKINRSCCVIQRESGSINSDLQRTWSSTLPLCWLGGRSRESNTCFSQRSGGHVKVRFIFAMCPVSQKTKKQKKGDVNCI